MLKVSIHRYEPVYSVHTETLYKEFTQSITVCDQFSYVKCI